MANSERNALAEIRKALVESGHTSLDDQARVLGLARTTAWTVITCQHKLGRLQLNTTMKILANPHLPPAVRAAVETYSASLHAHQKPRGARLG
jgi:hypothetical protein